MKTFANKSILVTGASSGIGKAFVEKLAGQAETLIITARSKGELDRLAQQIKSKNAVKVEVIALDLALPHSAETLYQEVRKRNLTVDVLINNAGFGKWGEFLSFDAATYSQMIQLNITTLTDLCLLFLPSLVKQGGGGIINVASTASFVPVPFSAVYGASKAFVLNFSEALSGEYGPQGVHITALCPGATATNFANVASDNKIAVRGDSAESVAEVGLKAFLRGDCTVIAGSQNYVVAFLPRLLTRKRVIQIVSKMWKARLKSS